LSVKFSPHFVAPQSRCAFCTTVVSFLRVMAKPKVLIAQVSKQKVRG
jgi:hypothetical protein